MWKLPKGSRRCFTDRKWVEIQYVKYPVSIQIGNIKYPKSIFNNPYKLKELGIYKKEK